MRITAGRTIFDNSPYLSITSFITSGEIMLQRAEHDLGAVCRGVTITRNSPPLLLTLSSLPSTE